MGGFFQEKKYILEGRRAETTFKSFFLTVLRPYQQSFVHFQGPVVNSVASVAAIALFILQLKSLFCHAWSTITIAPEAIPAHA
jgi:hypothetical protein